MSRGPSPVRAPFADQQNSADAPRWALAGRGAGQELLIRDACRSASSPGASGSGTHGYGQTYAVDLVFAPEGVDRPAFGTTGGVGFLPPERFPAFGQPVLAPADGEVVRAVGRMRDHRSRSSWFAFVVFVAESLPRELMGPTGVLGNHVVLRLADGSCFTVAHLRRGSVRVAAGQRVRVGDELGRCGNTGNSTKPHLHCQRQDVAGAFVAGGLPWSIRGRGIPPNGGVLDA